MAPWNTLQFFLLYLSCSLLFTTGHTHHHRHGHSRRHTHPSNILKREAPILNFRDRVAKPDARYVGNEAPSNPLRRETPILDARDPKVVPSARNPTDRADPQIQRRDTSLLDLIKQVQDEIVVSHAFLNRMDSDLASIYAGAMSLTDSSWLSSTSSSTTAAATFYSPASPSLSSPSSPSSSQPSVTASGEYRFNPKADDNLAVYYAQTEATGRVPLDSLCQDPSIDIVILAFVTSYFDAGGYPAVNFGAACGGQTAAMQAKAPSLLYCADLIHRITACQSIGKKIFISLGGAISTSSFTSDDQATQFAKTIWDLFGGGNGEDPDLRPFGRVTLDGFDIDNEDHLTDHYDTFFTALRSHFPTFNASTLSNGPPTASTLPKKYYISAAPQCPIPDQSIPLAGMQSADFVWVQFYNNPDCNLNAPGFEASFKAWSEDLGNGTNHGPKLYLGAPAFSGGGSGYMDAAELGGVIQRVRGYGVDNFGGVMLWDGAEAAENVAGGKNFIEGISGALKDGVVE